MNVAATTGPAMARSAHPTPASDPISHEKITASARPDANMSSDTPAARSDETAYPVRSSVTDGRRPPWRATPITSSTVPSPPKKANSWTNPMPSHEPAAPIASAGATSGSTMAMVAPSDAPAAVPMMYGSAIGLRRMAWKTVPAQARPAPTTMAPSTRGSRRSITIVSMLASTPEVAPSPSSRCPSTRTISSGVTATLPRPTPTTSATRRRAPPPPSTTAARVSAGARTSDRGATPARIGQLPKASGWIARASASRPSTMRGPGRVMTMSSVTDTTRPSTTAVIVAHPGLAATDSAVMVGS